MRISVMRFVGEGLTQFRLRHFMAGLLVKQQSAFKIGVHSSELEASELEVLQYVVVNAALIGIQRVIAGRGKPLPGGGFRRPNRGAQVFRGQRFGNPRFQSFLQLAFNGTSTTALRSAPEKCSVFLPN